MPFPGSGDSPQTRPARGCRYVQDAGVQVSGTGIFFGISAQVMLKIWTVGRPHRGACVTAAIASVP